MNKKLLFAAMSLAALTACTDNDFESQKVAQQEATPVTFEVLNNNDAFTRASMNGNKVAWSATDGDLFTLYHGGTLNDASAAGYQNATYTAGAAEGSPAVLTTPSMILPGGAIMVWPVDTAFSTTAADVPSIKIPAEQPADIENYIPYVSDEINIKAYDPDGDGKKIGNKNTAGYQREYPIYMRPMASQLNLKTDYAGTDATIAQLYDGGSACPADGGIEPISLTSVDLIIDNPDDGGTKKLTTKMSIKFSDPDGINAAIKASDDQWKSVKGNAWSYVTDFDAVVGSEVQLTTKCIQGLDGCKFLLLPQSADLAGTEKAAIVVNTIYGKVVIAENGVAGTKYTATEDDDAWYRFLTDPTTKTGDETETTVKNDKNQTKVTSEIKKGLMQTINGFRTYKATSGVVKYEPIGAAATRYVKVLLNHLDMSDLHVKTDKQLRDAALVWKHIGVGGGDVTILLDGDKTTGEIAISQKTIKLINDINAATAKEDAPRTFKVMPCQKPGEICKTIVITGASDIQNIQDLTFIDDNATNQADVALAAGETWKWDGTTATAKQIKVGEGVKSIINRGTIEHAANATLAIYDNTATQTFAVPFRNEGTWDITGGDINVQFDVTNLGIVNVSAGAEYHQAKGTFTNEALTLEARFLAAGKTEKIGKVNNSGVFAKVDAGTINNYGLIEHQTAAAKTYITSNQQTPNFANEFSAATGTENKYGRVNLPISIISNADNISISAALAEGFVSVTVNEGVKELKLSSVGGKVNYIIVNGGVEKIGEISDAISFLEINQPGTEISWTVDKTKTAKYVGLMILSPVNIKLDSKVQVTKATYLKAKMYVGGTFTNASYAGYFGDTSANEASMVITY